MDYENNHNHNSIINMTKITAEERENMIHQWKLLIGRGDLGEAALIKKKIEAQPLVMEKPKLDVVATAVTVLEEVLPGAVITKKKGTGKRGRPKGSKNKK